MSGRRRSHLARAGRRTNLALLILLLGAFLTGWLAFAAATSVPARLTTVAHGLLGLGVLVLVPWKTVVVRRAPLLRLASLLLAGVIIICLAAGFVEVFVGYGIFAGLSPIQVHVGAAFVAVPLVAMHLRSASPPDGSAGRPQPSQPAAHRGFRAGDRRRVRRAGGRRPGRGPGLRPADRHRVAPTGCRPRIPATIWFLDRVPVVATDHQVDIAGSLIPVSDLDARGEPVRARLDCTSGWYADAEWSGVPLTDLLPADRLAAARSLLVTSVTGYRRRFPVADASRLWLATRVEGRLLTAGTRRAGPAGGTRAPRLLVGQVGGLGGTE